MIDLSNRFSLVVRTRLEHRVNRVVLRDMRHVDFIQSSSRAIWLRVTMMLLNHVIANEVRHG